MKRSEINRLIQGSLAFFETMKFHLPAWGHWLPSDWRGKADVASEVIENMLGWDLTDFGSGDFERRGLILFTIRNGNPRSNDKAYAEKIMIVREGQETPMHFHWHKMEDIINRGGGNLAVELYGSTDDESLSDQPIKVKIDGVRRTVEPGGVATLGPGESICLERGMYHRFYGEKAKVLVGEVSSVNDDMTDNRFLEPVGRFPEIEEDEAPMHLLCTEYREWL